MRFIQAKHPAICWPLLPWLVEGDQTRQEIFLELYGRLEQEPENTFVGIALDGEFCKAVLIGYISDDHVWIWQARTSSDCKCQQDMFEWLSEWAKEKGIAELKAACSKDKSMRLFTRRFGFKKVGQEIQRSIT